MTQSGPDHPMTIEQAEIPVTVRLAGKTVAHTTRPLVMREAGYLVVYYVPIEDVDGGTLIRTNHHTHCPHKGDATYYTVQVEGAHAKDAAWQYPEPVPAAEPIRHAVAFYPGELEIEVGD